MAKVFSVTRHISVMKNAPKNKAEKDMDDIYEKKVP